MPDLRDHSNHVQQWMSRSTDGLSSEKLLQLFELAMAALWDRAYVTLGDVTLAAILERVLFTASERFPPFESLKVGPNGLDLQQLRANATTLGVRELEEGIRFVLAEFLVVIGNLTAEILTPVLHAELSKVTLKDPPAGSIQKEGKS